ncbi:hypothetical protein NPIL_14351 [Nephila pilipes]|uniref:Uncharacterized protein n=1 Tax=Nephila pilipes TaxID=299642 RepID=A0A8X6QVH7_NEPPI|nr:hypothetical protein NPIL_14351 [Nephila pilipes]
MPLFCDIFQFLFHLHKRERRHEIEKQYRKHKSEEKLSSFFPNYQIIICSWSHGFEPFHERIMIWKECKGHTRRNSGPNAIINHNLDGQEIPYSLFSPSHSLRAMLNDFLAK